MCHDNCEYETSRPTPTGRRDLMIGLLLQPGKPSFAVGTGRKTSMPKTQGKNGAPSQEIRSQQKTLYMFVPRNVRLDQICNFMSTCVQKHTSEKLQFIHASGRASAQEATSPPRLESKTCAKIWRRKSLSEWTCLSAPLLWRQESVSKNYMFKVCLSPSRSQLVGAQKKKKSVYMHSCRERSRLTSRMFNCLLVSRE